MELSYVNNSGNHTFNTCSDLKNLRGASVAAFNIRSLINKIPEIETILVQSKLDLLCLTETWLSNVHDHCEIQIDGYSCFRWDRTGFVN